MRMRLSFTAAMLLIVPVTQAAELVRFVSCPVYRDARAGRKSGCWLADDPDTGIRYDVTPSPVKPDWNHAVLVEGIVADTEDDPCGGVVLEPARVSVLPEACPRHMLPAEGYPGRPFVVPERYIRPTFVPAPVPPGPYETTTFHVYFEFDRSFLMYQNSDYFLEQAVDWIRAAKPERIVVTGYAVTEPETISGRVLGEEPAVARERAEKVSEALRRLGVPAEKIETRWASNPAPVDADSADGIASASRRRVDIRAIL